jgi:hypothetical protein
LKAYNFYYNDQMNVPSSSMNDSMSEGFSPGKESSTFEEIVDNEMVSEDEEEMIVSSEADEDEVSVPISDNPDKEQISGVAARDEKKKYSFVARRFRAMARTPWYHLVAALVVAGTLSGVGMVVGNFSVVVDNAGWQSRGTHIANRHTQVLLVLQNLNILATGSDEVWQELEDTVQPGWETQTTSTGNARGRELLEEDEDEYKALKESGHRTLPFIMTDYLKRRIQESSSSGLLEGCDTSYYSNGNILRRRHLWPLWKAKGGASALDPQIIRDICHAEQTTQTVLEERGLCKQCSNTDRCLPPFSLVFFVRLQVGDSAFELQCDELADAWGDFVGESTVGLQECVEEVKATYSFESTAPLPSQCPTGFSSTMVDEYFGSEHNLVSYTSSIFVTLNLDPDKLYEIVDKYDRAEDSKVVSGAYDTARESFVDIYVNESVGNDMILAMGSALITAFAVLVHTRSPWITLVGLLQIALSFPVAFFFYTFVARLEFFPFLNFIGVFVVFALGADDIFVATDKWKNARIDNHDGSVEDIAALALPDAAGAMMLTTITTAVAFFATAICPVAPLKCFAVFCGLLVVFDYILCLLLVFPALCIYDRWLIKGNNCCCSLHLCKKKGVEVDDFVEDESKPSLIRRILLGFYAGVHKIRWVLLAICIAATVVSAIFAARLELPQSSDVRLLKSSVQYEQAYEWRLKLLSDTLQRSRGSPGFVIWGVTPADTGIRTNPESFSQLVLDDSFDPSTTAGQEYMVNFCDKFFAEDFAGYTDNGYVCPINRFNAWLEAQSTSTLPMFIYEQYCGGATGLPISPQNFNPCISNWANTYGERAILSRDGIVQIMYIQFQQRVRFDSPYNEMNDEWVMIEDWMDVDAKSAPAEVNNRYHSSIDFWWFDTNGK